MIGESGRCLAIQSEIAKAIADQLQAKLSPTEKNAIEEAPTTMLLLSIFTLAPDFYSDHQL